MPITFRLHTDPDFVEVVHTGVVTVREMLDVLYKIVGEVRFDTGLLHVLNVHDGSDLSHICDADMDALRDALEEARRIRQGSLRTRAATLVPDPQTRALLERWLDLQDRPAHARDRFFTTREEAMAWLFKD
jgi:hypothetical protein